MLAGWAQANKGQEVGALWLAAKAWSREEAGVEKLWGAESKGAVWTLGDEEKTFHLKLRWNITGPGCSMISKLMEKSWDGLCVTQRATESSCKWLFKILNVCQDATVQLRCTHLSFTANDYPEAALHSKRAGVLYGVQLWVLHWLGQGWERLPCKSKPGTHKLSPCLHFLWDVNRTVQERTPRVELGRGMDLLRRGAPKMLGFFLNTLLDVRIHGVRQAVGSYMHHARGRWSQQSCWCLSKLCSWKNLSSMGSKKAHTWRDTPARLERGNNQKVSEACWQSSCDWCWVEGEARGSSATG